MEYGRINNGVFERFTPGCTIQVGDRLITNPSAEQLVAGGWKEIIEHEGNGGVYEDGDFIIVETMLSQPIQLTPHQQRESAYQSDLLIEWDSELFTCDRFRVDRLSPYFFAQNPRYEEALTAWLNARDQIQSMYPG